MTFSSAAFQNNAFQTEIGGPGGDGKRKRIRIRIEDRLYELDNEQQAANLWNRFNAKAQKRVRTQVNRALARPTIPVPLVPPRVEIEGAAPDDRIASAQQQLAQMYADAEREVAAAYGAYLDQDDEDALVALLHHL